MTGRTSCRRAHAIGVGRFDPEFEGALRAISGRSASHLFECKSHESVDQTAALAVSLGANIVRGPEERDWAPEYYYVLFEDPDGIRLELNHVPGTGLLNADASFGSADDYVRKDGKDLIDSRYAHLLRYTLSLISGPYIAL